MHTNSGRNSAEVSATFELICLRLQASLIFVVFPRSASVGRVLPEFQQGRHPRVGQSFAVELQDFMKANAWKACALVKI